MRSETAFSMCCESRTERFEVNDFTSMNARFRASPTCEWYRSIEEARAGMLWRNLGLLLDPRERIQGLSTANGTTLIVQTTNVSTDVERANKEVRPDDVCATIGKERVTPSSKTMC